MIMNVTRSLLRGLTLSVLCSVSASQSAWSISVQIAVVQGAYCSHPEGVLSAVVQGGTAPYTYDWYRIDLGVPVLICMGCGPTISSLSEFTSYKVVVTDALSATAEATEVVPGFFATILNLNGHYPYLLGSSPVVSYTVNGEGLGGMYPIHDSQVTPSTGLGGFTSGTETRTASLPPGTTSCMIAAWATWPPEAASCPAQVYGVTIGAPTVLPTITALQVLPSCSNGSTGRIDYSLTNGVIPQNIKVHLKNTSGTVLNADYFADGQMPTATGSFTGVGPGTYRLVVTGQDPGTPTNFGITGFNYTCRDSITVLVASTGVSCGQAQGSVFIDTNLNCTMQGGEPGVPGVVLKVLPGPYFVNTSSTGAYNLQLPAGNYTINEEHAQLGQNCSPTPIPFTVPAVITPVVVNVPCTALVAMDAQISLASGPARPGFALNYGIGVRNLTPTSTGNTTVTLQLDAVLAFVSADPAPSSVSGNTLTWNQAALAPFDSRSISIVAQVPPDVGLLGTQLGTTATLTTAITDGALANNTAVAVTTVTGSFDPNDKLAITSSGSTVNYDPAQDEWVDYTIRFQNTGTDTAFTVLVTDTLASNLDPGSIVMGAASHEFTWSIRGAGVLRFQFLNIRLPHVGVNEPRSHGFVSFRIKPKLPLVAGAQIINRANIYFDFNPAVITDPAVLTVPAPPVLVSPKVFLGGPYNSATTTMTDGLRVLGRVPLVEPYSVLGYVHTGLGGGETILPSALLVTGDNAIVDWVVVELRSASNSGAVLASRSALVQRDGDVVGMNGTSPVPFALAAGSYYVAVRHRNHLGVMTATTRALGTATTTVDFTVSGTTTFGTNARNTVGGRMVFWPGDVDRNGVVKYAGVGNDRDPILEAIGGSVPTSTVSNMYSTTDVNMDGVFRYMGANNDRDIILQTIGGSVPTATRLQQLP